MKKILLLGGLFFLMISCGQEKKNTIEAQFELLKSDVTGLNFVNDVTQTIDFNVFNYMYFYNGGGVATADFNNDGLPDIYLTSNMGENKMFLNESKMKFKDISEQAGVIGEKGWTTGATVVDINNDGLKDIYVSQIGEYENLRGSNQLYVCQKIENGIPIYKDEAAKYNLDLVGFGTQATFFDYDLDGDLDMFQVNHSIHQNGTFGRKDQFEGKQHPLSGDRLFRNDSKQGFTEVTQEAGIKSLVIGYGLGLAIGDFNNDGWADIYVGNDFHEDDYMYLNQQDGTFKDVRPGQLMHTSRFSMGVEIADINNDGWNDIYTLDMLPEDPYILKTSLGEDGFNQFKLKLGFGYQHQYARNNLQINNGNGTFSEVGMFANVYASDWSWGTLIFDFDWDGYKDVFVSNGIPRRMNDIDYMNFRLSDDNLKYKTSNNVLEKQEILDIVERIPTIKIPNKFYQNTGQISFTDIHQKILNDENTFSNGTAYADFDGDGDLDIITNNLFDTPFIYKNLTAEKRDTIHTDKNFIFIKPIGSPNNIDAIGAKLIIKKKNGEQLIRENFPTRGYQSSVQEGLYLGIGKKELIEEIILIWPDHSYETILPKFNQVEAIRWRAGLPKFDFLNFYKKTPQFNFKDITETTQLNYKHKENPFVEFNRERLMPHMVSSDGPALAVGDVNGDGLEDVFLGSAKFERSQLFIQQSDGTFEKNTPMAIVEDSIFEDVDAVFIDIDNDNDLDLAIAAGGNEFKGTSEPLKQRIYLNEGNGVFFEKIYLPNAYVTASCILPTDINQDGKIDIFIGGRAVTSNYGVVPSSYLFLNKGNGEFEDVTDKYSKSLQKAGLVKDGKWVDIDKDGDEDLILATEWNPIQIYINENQQLIRHDINDMTGWWSFVMPYDVDNDGDIDLVAGNLGENTRFEPTKKEPVRMYLNDFDDNGKVEQILTYYMNGKEIPFANHAELTMQLPHLKKNYILSKDLARASLEDILGKKKLKTSIKYEVNTFQSMYFENKGNLKFDAKPLPDVLQWSSMESAFLQDLDADGIQDLLIGGNFYDSNIEMGRYDSNFGNVLKLNKEGLKSFSLGEVSVKGQVRHIQSIRINGKSCFIFAKNNEPVQVLQLNE